MTFTNLEKEANNSISLADEIFASSTYLGSLSSSVDDDYRSDVFISVKFRTRQGLDYKLDLRHAEYDVDGHGSVCSATDGAAILSSLITDRIASKAAANLFKGGAPSTLSGYLTALSGSLLDVDGDGVTSADTDGVILQAFLAGASASDLLPLISATSPIETADELLTHLLDIA